MRWKKNLLSSEVREGPVQLQYIYSPSPPKKDQSKIFVASKEYSCIQATTNKECRRKGNLCCDVTAALKVKIESLLGQKSSIILWLAKEGVKLQSPISYKLPLFHTLLIKNHKIQKIRQCHFLAIVILSINYFLKSTQNCYGMVANSYVGQWNRFQ